MLAKDSDGSDVTHIALNQDFSDGLFVAMSDDKTYHYYSWADFEKAILTGIIVDLKKILFYFEYLRYIDLYNN